MNFSLELVATLEFPSCGYRSTKRIWLQVDLCTLS